MKTTDTRLIIVPDEVLPSLATLADEIRKADGEFHSGMRTSLSWAIVAGEKLTQAKSTMKHGGWLPWLEQFEFDQRTAQDYMQAYRNRGLLANTRRAAHLKSFLKLIAGKAKKEEKEEIEDEEGEEVEQTEKQELAGGGEGGKRLPQKKLDELWERASSELEYLVEAAAPLQVKSLSWPRRKEAASKMRKARTEITRMIKRLETR